MTSQDHSARQRHRDLVSGMGTKELQISAGSRQITLSLVQRAQQSDDDKIAIAMPDMALSFYLPKDMIPHLYGLPALESLPETLALAVASAVLRPLFQSLGTAQPELSFIAPYAEADQAYRIHLFWHEAGVGEASFSISYDEASYLPFQNWAHSFAATASEQTQKERSSYRIEIGHTYAGALEIDALKAGDILLLEEDYEKAGRVRVRLDSQTVFLAKTQEGGVEIAEAVDYTPDSAENPLSKIIFDSGELPLDVSDAASIGGGTILLAPDHSAIVVRCDEEILARGKIVRFNNLKGIRIEAKNSHKVG